MDYRIEELADKARTTVRNVRAYQERGILPPPRREGRVAIYGDAHLARLRVIGSLLERGYSLGNIAELIDAWARGSDLRELLGLEQAITGPFADEPEESLSFGELAELFGTSDPVAVAKGIAIGLFSVDKDRVVVPSTRLLRAGAELHAAGIPLAALLDEIEALRGDVDRIAGRFVDLVMTHVFDPYARSFPVAKEAARLAELVRRVRPLAEVVVVTELGRALDKHVRARLGERLGRWFERNAGARPRSR